MTTDLRAPKGAEWDEAIETLHRVTHLLTTRAHYPERHPAIGRRRGNLAFEVVLAAERPPSPRPEQPADRRRERPAEPVARPPSPVGAAEPACGPAWFRAKP